jgi:hypothetical protein
LTEAFNPLPNRCGRQGSHRKRVSHVRFRS